MNPRKGDTVRLAQSVTLAEFGLALCDDDGAGLEIDGVVIEEVLGVIKGVVIAAIHLPTKTHTLHPVSNGGVFDRPARSFDFPTGRRYQQDSFSSPVTKPPAGLSVLFGKIGQFYKEFNPGA